MVLEPNVLRLNKCIDETVQDCWKSREYILVFWKRFFGRLLQSSEHFNCLDNRYSLRKDFCCPGVLVLLLRSWHAAPSRDETVPLASYQRPADWGHVSARLSVNNCSSLPSPLLCLFTLSPSSASCLPHLALWLSIPLVSSLLKTNSFVRLISLIAFVGLIFHFGAFPPEQPSLSVSSLSHSRRDPAARMTSPVDEQQRASSVSWMRRSKCRPTIHHNTEGNNSNHSTSRLLSEQNLKSLRLHNSTLQNSHSELCQREMFCQKIIFLYIIYFMDWLTFIHSIIQKYH